MSWNRAAQLYYRVMRNARRFSERLVAAASAAALLTLFLGCYPGRSYSGPGEVERYRWPFVNFKVRFDVRSMAPGESQSWEFRGLPELDSIIGFVVSSRSGLTCMELKDSPLADCSARLELRRRDGSVVVAKSGPLRDWVWNYGGGGGEACSVYDRSLKFLPSRSAEYRLTFVIDGPWPSDAALGQVHVGSYASYSL